MRAFKRSGIPELSGVNAELIAELCGVHVTTARRWKRGEYPPLSALKVIALYQTGELGAVDPKWNGWSLRNGSLTTPDEAYTFTPGEVQAIPFHKQLIRHYQDEQRLPRQGDWVSEKWIPAAELEVAKRA
jgi:hypothetical protein